MPKAPNPITSPPAQPFQPWDATEKGTADSAPGSGNVYDGNSTWVKVKDGGASNGSGGLPGGWPDDGASSSGGWKQC